MNNEQVQGKADQILDKIKEIWAKLTDNDFMLYKAQRQQFLGKVKEVYGITIEDAEKKLKAIEDACCTSSDSSSSAKVA